MNDIIEIRYDNDRYIEIRNSGNNMGCMKQ